jgi:hypothetical protein
MTCNCLTRGQATLWLETDKVADRMFVKPRYENPFGCDEKLMVD